MNNYDVLALIFVVLNVVLVLFGVGGWLAFILWKDSLKDVFKDLQDAIDTHNKILARTFEES